MKSIFALFAAVALAGCAREYQTCGQLSMQTERGVYGYASNEVIATSTTHAVSTGTFGPGYVRILCTAYAYMATGANPAATTTDPIAGTQPFFMYLPSAVKISFEALTGTGSCSITPMSAQ